MSSFTSKNTIIRSVSIAFIFILMSGCSSVSTLNTSFTDAYDEFAPSHIQTEKKKLVLYGIFPVDTSNGSTINNYDSVNMTNKAFKEFNIDVKFLKPTFLNLIEKI
jgi:hypothetical protein